MSSSATCSRTELQKKYIIANYLSLVFTLQKVTFWWMFFFFFFIGMWLMTHEMRHATWDTWWGVIIFSKYQLPRSYCLGGTVFLRYFHNGQVIDLMSNGGVCRAVPTTPCLLKGGCHNFWYLNHVSGSYELAWKCTFQENSKTKDCQKTGFSTFSDWILSSF